MKNWKQGLQLPITTIKKLVKHVIGENNFGQ